MSINIQREESQRCKLYHEFQKQHIELYKKNREEYFRQLDIFLENEMHKQNKLETTIQ